MSTYLLIILSKFKAQFQVGALGEVMLAPGWYLYVGSAKRHLDARIRRHLTKEKRHRWHIDYLLSTDVLTIKEIWLGEKTAECRMAGSLLTLPEVTIPQPRLGASDCRCPAHFFHYANDLSKLRQYLASLDFTPYPPA